ncbi:MAG: glycogen debranching protein GlgX [Pseudomonadota bacterium]
MTPPRFSGTVLPGSARHLGARFEQGGVNFAVFSAHGERVELCLFSANGKHETARLTLPERTGHIWHGFVEGLGPGQVYGYRVHGPYAPEKGHRFNPHKLLLDPYTRELCGVWDNHDARLGYRPGHAKEDLSFDRRDSARHVAKSVVSHPALFAPKARETGIPFEESIIYETHPKGLTMANPAVPEKLRGTYEGIAHPAMIDHLLKLGVTAVELLPVHHFIDDGFLIERGLRNYWGYNTVGFFAPEPRYFGPLGYHGFAAMVDKLHAAGLEVILDVVYNHTAEGDQRGPTLSFRGLDNASYYSLQADNPRFYVNDTGCGNTVNVSNPHVLRLVMDSLRFWVEQMGVDGFRFDLASTLARQPDGFDRRGAFLNALRQDPVMGSVKLIAEPWDIGPGGYQVGAFPAPIAEWNDRFRDGARAFWRGDKDSTRPMGSRLLASAETFDHGGRPAWSSVNFITAHDGFTLADLTRYNERHNEANGEDNADGHGNNISDNMGVEGETEDPAIHAARAQRQRNMLATLMLSQGTPMLLAGDEFGNSQQGNNNAYAQDNETGWLDWDSMDETLMAFCRRVIALRKAHPALGQTRFLHGEARSTEGLKDVMWLDFAGHELHWEGEGPDRFALLVRMAANGLNKRGRLEGDDAVLIAINRSDDEAHLTLPNGSFVCQLDTHDRLGEPPETANVMVLSPHSVMLFAKAS